MVAQGVTLTIRAGVDVRAFANGVLLVTRGSKLIANGSATSPITFSSLDTGYDGTGEWGGVIIRALHHSTARVIPVPVSQMVRYGVTSRVEAVTLLKSTAVM